MAIVKNNNKLFKADVKLELKNEEDEEVVQELEIVYLEVEQEVVQEIKTTNVERIDNFEQFLEAQLQEDVVEDEVVVVEKKQRGKKKKAK